MKILLTAHQFFPQHFAGTEVATRDVGLELLARGHEVHVLTVDPSPGNSGPEVEAEDYDHRGLSVHALRVPDRLPARRVGAQPVRLEYLDEAVGEHVREWSRELRPDVVHMFHLARLTGSTLDSLRELGVPLVFTATDFWSLCVRGILMKPGGELCGGPDQLASNCLECRRADRWFGIDPPSRPSRRRALYRQIGRDALAANGAGGTRAETVRAALERGEALRERFRRVDAILAPTALMRDMLIANGLPDDLIRVHPYSIDVAPFAAATERRDRNRAGVRFAYVGTVNQPKGVHVLIRAFRHVPNPDATLEIIGDVNAEPDYFRELYALALGDDRIRFVGGIPNERIPERLKRIDVQVVPSIWYENAPLTIYSAQAAGIPVVASNLGGMSELVSDDENGLLFEPGSVSALATQLRRLAADPEVIDRLSANARAPVGATQGVDQLLALYEEIRAAGVCSPERGVDRARSEPRSRPVAPPRPKPQRAPAPGTPAGVSGPVTSSNGHGPRSQATAQVAGRRRPRRSTAHGARRRAAARRRRREIPSVFFVVGRAKSGTTWLMRILDAHPEIACRGEGRLFGRDYVLPGRETATIPARPLAGALAADASLRSWLERSVWARDDDPDEQLRELTTLAIDYFLSRTARETGKPIVGDKTPFLTPDTIREIAQLCPTAKVVHVIRDGRDVAISAKHHTWNHGSDAGGIHELADADRAAREAYRADPGAFGTHGRSLFAAEWLAGTAREWAELVGRARTDGRELLGERYHEIRYEDVLADPIGCTGDLLEFLDADTEASVIERCVEEASFERATSGRRRGDERPTEFLRNGLAGQWRAVFTPGDREIFKRAAGDRLIELGYEGEATW